MKKKLLKKMYAEFEAKEKAEKQKKKDIKKCLKVQKKLGVENPTPIRTYRGDIVTDKCEIKKFLSRLAEKPRQRQTFAEKVEAQEKFRKTGEL